MDEITAQDHALPVKVVLLGSSTVGKTSLVNTAMQNEFVEDQQPTIGACFVIKKINVGDRIVRLHLWDTAGQERFRSLAPMYYRDAQVALILYAIDDEVTFEAVRGWYEGVLADCQNLPKIYLIGNKKDLENRRVVPESDGRALAEKFGAKFFEVSAKEDVEGVLKLFDDIAALALEMYDTAMVQDMEERTVDPNTAKKKNGCC